MFNSTIFHCEINFTTIWLSYNQTTYGKPCIWNLNMIFWQIVLFNIFEKKTFKEKHAVSWFMLDILSQVDLHCFSWALRSGFKFSILSAPSLSWFNPAMFIQAAPYIWSSDISPLVRIPRNTVGSIKLWNRAIFFLSISALLCCCKKGFL